MTTTQLLTWGVLALSFFTTISLLWLGLMVLLNGNRHSAGTWLTGCGLLLGAIFFTSHTAILGRGLASTSFGMDFWWWVSWGPAVVAPLAWYAAMLWYSGFLLDKKHPQFGWIMVVIVLAVLTGLFVFIANPLPSYQSVAGRQLFLTPSFASIPILVWTYLLYSLLCYLLPVDLLRRPNLPSMNSLNKHVHQQAVPWLAAASISLLLASILMIWTALWILRASPPPTLQDPQVLQIVLALDFLVSALVAVAVTVLGRAIVAYEVFTGRPLPRNGFFRQWRSTVILAGGFGLVAGWMLAIELRPVYNLMLATALMTLFYALFSWRSYSEREEFMKRLRPFISSQDLYGQLLSASPPERQAPQALFDTLCRDVLVVTAAQLIPSSSLTVLIGLPLNYSSGSVSIPLSTGNVLSARYPSPKVHCLPGIVTGVAWDVPLWNERGLAGVLMLGEKLDRSPYTEEEIEIAQAGGERLLDMLSGVQIASIAMTLLRQRITQTRVLEGQGRRVLHDEILPELHCALLYLSSLPPSPPVNEALQALSQAHHHIADMMRSTPPGAPLRLSQVGLVISLHDLIHSDFESEFQEINWHVEPEAEQMVRNLPLFACEVIYFAVRELLRNAARHGRGGDQSRKICIDMILQCVNPDMFCLAVQDNGVGFFIGIIDSSPEKSGVGEGLRFHSAMLSVIGANLEVDSIAAGGTKAKIVMQKPINLEQDVIP